MNLFNFLYLDGSDQEVGEAEAREMTSDEIADLRALPHKFSGESTRNVGESPPEEVFLNGGDISSSRNEDVPPREVGAKKCVTSDSRRNAIKTLFLCFRMPTHLMKVTNHWGRHAF